MNTKVLKLIFSISICLAAGLIGSFFTADAISNWYATVNKPDFNPPNWIFGPVWTTLYILMGISLYRIWVSVPLKKHISPNKKKAIVVFGIQLILNTIWSIIFFGLENPGIALLEIYILLAAIVYTKYLFCKIDKLAGYLLIPYIAWVTFASILNFFIWQLN